ncbi:MAG: FAD-dependent oxidoreductase [Mariniblastus sp.]|nr:FAD-dependent oxidoreductase [Mariniblastus sp.]
MKSESMKFGIIGSGIAGLSAAWMLDRAGHQVTLFECRESLGMSLHAVDLERDGFAAVGDVPSRMFNRHQWPNLHRLYEILGVATEPVMSSQSFSRLGESAYLKLKNAYRPSRDLPALLNRHNRRLMTTAAKLKTAGLRDLESGIAGELTLDSYLNQAGVSEEFKLDFLYPTLSSTVCTCSYDSLKNYPASIILKVLRGLTSEGETLLKTKNGTRDVVRRLVSGGFEIRLGTRVQAVRQGHSDTVDLTIDLPGGGTKVERFDHVIISTQANHARDLLTDEASEDRKTLALFEYEDIPVIVHSDRELMPPKRSEWATFNMVSSATPKARAMCSVYMNQFHSDWDWPFSVFQTILPIKQPRPETVLQSAQLQRPIVNQRSHKGWAGLDQGMRQPSRRIWLCGSYAVPGVPLLETGVVSAARVLDALSVDSPFTSQDLASSLGG